MNDLKEVESIIGKIKNTGGFQEIKHYSSADHFSILANNDYTAKKIKDVIVGFGWKSWIEASIFYGVEVFGEKKQEDQK